MNNSMRNFSLMLAALTELQPEIEAAQQAKPVPAAPSLADSLSELGPMPREALLLGLASDGLPVLLNLHDPHPGPLLIAADPGTGKTALLQLIARITSYNVCYTKLLRQEPAIRPAVVHGQLATGAGQTKP